MTGRERAVTGGALAALACVAACASGARRFPLRPPLTRDTDLDSRSVSCRPDPKAAKDAPGHRLCRPDAYESSFAWDAADNILFRPIVRFFAVDPGGEAVNVNSLDEVPDSSWFVNRIGRHPMSVAEILRGSCEEAPIDIESADGSWLIDMGKANGANPGFRVRLPDGRKYMLKADLPDQPERATAATTIASRIYHAAGWWAVCDTVIYVKPSIFRLTPGLKVVDNRGVSRPLDAALLASLLAHASRRGDRVRFAASRWLPGRTLGPFTYAGIRADDPGDVIAHEDRRDLRGARLFAAWLNHFDSREQNSMTTWIADDPGDPDSSPGKLLHYYIDLGDCFGSSWQPDAFFRRLGHTYYFDFGQVLEDFVTLGVRDRPWDRGRGELSATFGYYRARDFEPSEWHGGYPNPAFGRMTERDGAWAARIMARFDDAAIDALVGLGDFTNPADSAFLRRELAVRRDAILRRYLGRASPVTDLVVDGGELCGVDLARRSGLFAESLFRYQALADAGGRRAAAATRALPEGRVCVTLPRIAGDGGVRDDDPSRYLTVELDNRQAVGRLRAHLYDLGPARGHVLVGVERSP